MEQTLVLLKPETMSSNLIGRIIDMFEDTHYMIQIEDIKMVKVTKELAEEHYQDLKDEPHFNKLIMHLTGKFHGTNKIIAMIIKGENAIENVRELVGATDPEEAYQFTIRGMFGKKREIDGYEVWENMVHASSSKKEAKREIKLWFG